MNVKIYLRISISFDRILGGGKVSFDNNVTSREKDDVVTLLLDAGAAIEATDQII
jgi:hypothetical protein